MTLLKRYCVAAFAGLVGVGSGVAGAKTLDVQFGVLGNPQPSDLIYQGTAAAPDTGTFWNQMASPGTYTNSIGSLSYSDTTSAPGITVTTNNPPAGGGQFGSASVYYPTPPAGTNALLNSYFYNLDAPVSFTIGGLDTTGTVKYDLYLYGTNGLASNSIGATFTITAGSGTLVTPGNATTGGRVSPNGTGPSAPVTATTISAGSPNAATADGSGTSVYSEYAVYADTLGNITVQWNGSNDTGPHHAGIVNGFQLIPAPEPCSAGLLAIGALGLLGRSRRQSV